MNISVRKFVTGGKSIEVTIESAETVVKEDLYDEDIDDLVENVHNEFSAVYKNKKDYLSNIFYIGDIDESIIDVMIEKLK